jgi:hypothetical protein
VDGDKPIFFSILNKPLDNTIAAGVEKLIKNLFAFKIMSSFSLVSPPTIPHPHILTRHPPTPPSPIFSLYRNPLSLHAHNTTPTNLSSPYGPIQTSKLDTVAKISRGSFRISSLSNIERELGTGSQDDEEEEIEGVSPTSVLPDRWDVLGLGQAMVFLSFLLCFSWILFPFSFYSLFSCSVDVGG